MGGKKKKQKKRKKRKERKRKRLTPHFIDDGCAQCNIHTYTHTRETTYRLHLLPSELVPNLNYVCDMPHLTSGLLVLQYSNQTSHPPMVIRFTCVG
jgi:hypothetical protein